MPNPNDADLLVPTGDLVDASQVSTSSGTVKRQRTVIGDDQDPQDLARVTDGSLQVSNVQFDRMLLELKRITAHLQLLTEQEITDDELADE